jgi:hypothetical protein
MDFSFFTKDNTSGHKTKETWFKKNHAITYNNIIEYCDKIDLEMNFKEKIWFYFNKLTYRPKCLTCNKEVKFRNRFDKPYGDFCSLNCANSNKDELIKRQKETFQKNYGVDHYPQHKDFVRKQKQTKKEKYGNENYNNIEKSKKTRKKRYGDENYNNIDKVKKTNLELYGNENYSNSNSYINKIKDQYRDRYKKINIKDVKKDVVIIHCDICQKESELTKQLLYERHKRDYNVCLHCNPIGNGNRSGYELEMSEFLNSLNIKHKTNEKIGDSKIEVDIYIPENKLAIEINGLYWHNELFKSKNFHLNKTVECEKHGITLLHIFEDEWVYKKEIVKSIIKNKLRLSNNKIYARKCEIRPVNHQESIVFMEDNHIQGKVKSSVRLGLYHQDMLVSLMTFSKGRVIMGGKKDEWELNRFCNLTNINVIGGFSRLLKHFIVNYKPNKIISYSDIRIFDGKIYENNNFKKISYSKPNYWYVINGLRHYRFNFRKSQLTKEGYDNNLTERQIMFNRKIYRIYDCGNIRWEYNC